MEGPLKINIVEGLASLNIWNEMKWNEWRFKSQKTSLERCGSLRSLSCSKFSAKPSNFLSKTLLDIREDKRDNFQWYRLDTKAAAFVKMLDTVTVSFPTCLC